MNIEEVLVEIELKNDNDFLKIKETLSRIGIKSKGENVLTQSCNILHKAGKYYIVHFKQMFMLDGRDATLSAGDKARLNRIVGLLEKWNLLTVLNNPYSELGTNIQGSDVYIIKHGDKENWTLKSKYEIGI